MKLSAGVWRWPPGVPLAVLAEALCPAASLRWTHTWEPHGESCVGLSLEQRLILHSWPEDGTVAVDLWSAVPVDLAEVLSRFGAELLEQHRF